jgi:hypothetical protein
VVRTREGGDIMTRSVLRALRVFFCKRRGIRDTRIYVSTDGVSLDDIYSYNDGQEHRLIT